MVYLRFQLKERPTGDLSLFCLHAALAETYLKKASTSTTNPNMAQISCRVLGDLYLNHDQPIKAARQYEQCLKYGSVSELVLDGLEKAKEMIRDIK